MQVGDCSLWHCLIFCEEFASDDCKNDFVCWVCKGPVSGYPVFNCLECDFIHHKVCIQLPNLTKMDIEHDITERHHLILREDMEDDGTTKVGCAGCGKLASSPTYRCSIPHCAFHLHKSCHQLSHAILHNAHPNHALILALPPPDYWCDLCMRDREKRTTLLYGCRLCNFDMDSKCISRWNIIGSKKKMEAGDYSIWHYLIFCEEFMSDDYENNVICWVCEEPISGHLAFKCLECSFVQHKSCTQLSDLTEMDLGHHIWDRHHLILQEETKNNAEEVVCVGCGDVASDTAYRCSIPKCTFNLHKACHQLSHAIQHITHPEHPLVLTMPGFQAWCGFCGKDREKETTLLYSCLPCNFQLDNKCASSLKITECNFDPHAFILCQKLAPFKCEACGEATNDFACQCSICGVLTHPMCASFPCMIKIIAHHHFLSRTYCLRRVKKLEKAICKLCCKNVNTEHGAYYCPECDYITHMKCAKEIQDTSTINSEATEFEDYTRHLVYLIEGLNGEEDKVVDVPSKINHNNHPQHELILRFEDSRNDKQFHKNENRCAVCMQFIIFPPFYCCEDCNIFVHRRCAELPKTVRRPQFGKNQYMLSSHLLSSTNHLFQCSICDIYRHGLFYKSRKTRIDVQCFLIPDTISHKCHRHLLHLPILPDFGFKEICVGCGRNFNAWDRYLMCSECKFWLCLKCAILPLVARYRYHPHLLKLTYTCEDDSEECYCLLCEEKLDPKYWFYSCTDCDFPAHIKCVIGSSLQSGRHEHPVILVRKCEYSLQCHLCEKSISNYDRAFECNQCKFNFHIKCYY